MVRINNAIRKEVAEETVQELMNPDAQLPEVFPFAEDLYQRELATLQQQSPEVSAALELDNVSWKHWGSLLIVMCPQRIARSTLYCTHINIGEHFYGVWISKMILEHTDMLLIVVSAEGVVHVCLRHVFGTGKPEL